MNDESSPATDNKDAIVATLADELQLCGGQAPSSDQEFWEEAAVHFRLSPEKALIDNAKAVLRALGDSEWDDDYLDENGDPTVSLYETMSELLQQSTGNESTEEDDTSIAVPASVSLEARPAPMTIAVAFDYIKKGVMVLHPEWQRSFVWKTKKQKRLIESVLLGLPIPSFLLYEDSTSGKIYVIDGRQRLETITRFMSPKEAKGEPKRRFRTFSASEEGWRAGERLNRAANRYYQDLPQDLRTTFDFTSLTCFKFKDIPMEKLYEIFKRYNSGAVALNAAEIRNAVYQSSPLHQMMFKLAGEHGPKVTYDDPEEQRVMEDLRETMRGKKQRYGAYDFIGRYFAFANCENGSAAKATNKFMGTYSNDAEATERFRTEFIKIFRTAVDSWYQPYPLTEPRDDGSFHAFLGTLQLVSTRRMLAHVEAKSTTNGAVREAISRHWLPFALDRLKRKQNSTLFWTSQKTWISLLEDSVAVPRLYPDHKWEADYQVAEEDALR